MVKDEAFKEKSAAFDYRTAAKDLLIFAVFYILSASEQFGFACAYGAYCCLLYFYGKKPMLLLCFSAAALLNDFSLSALYGVIIPAFALNFTMLALYRRNIRFSPLKVCILASLFRLTILFGGGDSMRTAAYLVEIFISAIFMLLTVNAFKAPLFRGLKHKISVDELVCAATFAMALYAGLYSIDLYGFKLYSAAAVFTILLSLYVYTLSFTLTYAVIIGAAVCMLSASPAYLGVYALFALCAGVFKDTSKYLCAVSVVLIDLLLAYYFKIYDSYGYMDIVSVSAGCLPFLFVSAKTLQKLSSAFGNRQERQLSRHIINRTRAELNLKLLSVGEVFYEMEKIFSGMIKGYMSPEDAVNMLSNDAINEVCACCTEYAKCFKANKESVESAFRAVVGAGIDKGKVTLLDIPPALASVCAKTNCILNVCGRLSGSYRQYAIVVSNLDTGRALIGRQFKGVGDILKQLAKETKNSVGFDQKTERVIIEELAYHNIACCEAVVYNENSGDAYISLLLKARDSFDKNISRIISSLTGTKMVVCGREESRREGYSVLHLKPAPKFDVIFGAAGCAKEGKEISGDTHSLTRISEDRFLLALCDGMGSGESAEKTSSMAISMVENFYRAGFDSETILSGVNRLLNVGGEDNFAALDICAIDLSKGLCDFIKLGSPEGYIKSKKETVVIASNALPVGILDELKPSIAARQVSAGDIIVLTSDGVSDSFGEGEGLREFIFSEESSNPQQLAENILQRALSLSGGKAKDDMTVLTMRVFSPV